MALFDILGRTVSEASQKTIAKTREFADTSRLNTMIYEEERTLGNLYYQVGKLYISLHKEDGEEAFSELIRNVSETEARINNYRTLIQNIRGVQRCPRCGGELPAGSAFCCFCGTPVPKVSMPEERNYVKCQSCGAFVKAEMKFCTSCGRPMNPAHPAEIPQKTPDSAAYAPKEKLCPNCGAKMAPQLLFCTECGTRL